MSNEPYFSHMDLGMPCKEEAINFAEWISNHPLLFQPSTPNGSWIGCDFVVKSSAQLYNEYVGGSKQA